MTKKAGGIGKSDLQKVKEEIYSMTIDLGGAITAEHGIGKMRTGNLNRHSNKELMDLMKKIKEIFDPNNILNLETVLHQSQV